MTGAHTLPLLLEVGCEEIPARFVVAAEAELGLRFVAQLRNVRLGGRTDVPAAESMPYDVYSTPRRLVVHVHGILGRQPDMTEEVTGPPVKVAFDKEGKPTRAAESFAVKNGATVEDLYRVTTPKGEYLAVKKTTHGRPALEVLGEVLPAVITGLSFPKSMYWEASKVRWVRPIRWILTLLGEGEAAQVVPFEVAGVKSGNQTYGRRTGVQSAHDSPITVTGFDDYVRKLREHGVEFDAEQRCARVEEEVKAVLDGSGLRVVEDKGLEDWIVNSTEWPRALLGSFDGRYLKLPREILITVMRDHQKYFAVEGEQGNLQPSFVTVINQDGDPQGLIKNGHERVLAARFADAEFFWKADQKIPLRDRLPMLERVTYQAKLGSYGDKVRRMEAIARKICSGLEKQDRMTPAHTAFALRAVQLCKCDLTTQMVQEFTELQGVVGGLYVAAQGEPKDVAEAIYDHYLPQGAHDKCPRSIAGAVVSLADKIDSVVAGFAAGLEPTGSSDPFGQRRAGNGVVKLIVEFDMPISLRECFDSQLSGVGSGVVAGLRQFLEERLRYYLETEKGFRYDTVRAVLERRPLHEPAQLPWESPLAAFKVAKSLEAMRETENFDALASAAKRVRNILKKSATGTDWQSGRISNDLLVEPEERTLSSSREAAFWVVGDLGIKGQYLEAFERIASLRPKVDQFFDKVLVMADDLALRQNRLRLLESLDQLFSSIADLSQIESSTLTNVDASTS